MDELTREFLIESQEGLDRMERCLTQLETRPGDAGLLAEIFRSVHTIKGTTGFLGFKRLEKLAHAGENLLSLLRDGALAANAEIITGLLQLLDAGYLYIGMDHFAKPNDELASAQASRTLHRNFQGYTTKAGADLYGMGVTAISGFRRAYAQNFRELPAWEKAVAERGLATMRGYRLSEEDRLRREVISRLLCHTVIPKREIEQAFGIDFDQHFAEELRRLETPAKDGLLTMDQDEIRTTWLGRIFIRNLAMLFDPYLEKQHLDAQPLFSKTL